MAEALGSMLQLAKCEMARAQEGPMEVEGGGGEGQRDTWKIT